MMKRFVFGVFIILVVSAVAYSQNNCTEEDKQRARSIAQKLELGSRVKYAVENGNFGDCVHYAWMDEMRKFGVKRVAAVIRLVWKGKIEKLEITRISFSLDYEEFNPETKDKDLLKQIEISGLKKQLEDEILERVRNQVFVIIESLKKDYTGGQIKTKSKEKIVGTLFYHLLDDEALPILANMSIVEL